MGAHSVFFPSIAWKPFRSSYPLPVSPSVATFSPRITIYAGVCCILRAILYGIPRVSLARSKELSGMTPCICKVPVREGGDVKSPGCRKLEKRGDKHRWSYSSAYDMMRFDGICFIFFCVGRENVSRV